MTKEAKQEDYVPGDSGFVIKKLNEIIKRKDTRIKELEKERDDLAVGFASWMEKHEKSFAYYLDGIEYWTGDITVNQLLEEYKKQLTK